MLDGSDTTPKQVLLEAAALIERPGAWTQGTLARNAAGSPVWVHHESAECFCAAGAINRIAGSRAAAQPTIEILRRHLDCIYHTGIGVWNDDKTRTQAEVVEALRQAAEALT